MKSARNLIATGIAGVHTREQSTRPAERFLSKQAKSESKAQLRDAQRRYLDLVLERDPRRRTLTEIAREGGLNPTTLTRFYNNPGYAGVLDALSIRRVAEVTGIAPSAGISGAMPAAGLAEDAVPYDTKGDALEQPLKLLVGNRPAASIFVLRSHALEESGYQPGDIVILDLNATPEAGDAVCAQIYDFARMRAQTVWRIFEPPYLIPATRDPAMRKPILVDNDVVAIKGVITESLRIRGREK